MEAEELRRKGGVSLKGLHKREQVQRRGPIEVYEASYLHCFVLWGRDWLQQWGRAPRMWLWCQLGLEEAYPQSGEMFL